MTQYRYDGVIGVLTRVELLGKAMLLLLLCLLSHTYLGNGYVTTAYRTTTATHAGGGIGISNTGTVTKPSLLPSLRLLPVMRHRRHDTVIRMMSWTQQFQWPFGNQPSSSSSSQSAAKRSALKVELTTLLKARCQPNGLNLPASLRADVDAYVNALTSLNPTPKPAVSPLMNGFWRMLYTDFAPAGTSAGQLGPFVGEVFQDLNADTKVIKNILRVRFPPIVGALVADQAVRDVNTWEIAFDRVGNSIFGIKLPTTKFAPRAQIRLWEIVYLDNDLRILRARREEADKEDSFVFILERDEASRIAVDV